MLNGTSGLKVIRNVFKCINLLLHYIIKSYYYYNSENVVLIIVSKTKETKEKVPPGPTQPDPF